MSEPLHPDPDPAADSGQVLLQPPVKKPDDDLPMEPNPYMGGGVAPA